MRAVSMDEASNWFRACFFTTAMRPSATVTRPFKMRKKCRNPSTHAPEIRVWKIGNKVHSTPNQIARFKLPS